MAKIVEIKGDLFTCPPHFNLAHTVSVDLKMSLGIAKIFKERYGQVSFLKTQISSVGNCASLIDDNGRRIFYLATKKRFFNKPSPQSIRAALQSLKSHMIFFNLSFLAMPRIASGLDKLYWPDVRRIISDVFADSPHITIHIFYL